MKHSLACAGLGMVIGAAFALSGCGSEDLDGGGGLVDGGGATGGNSGAGGASGSGGTDAVPNSALGSSCVTDLDCGAGLQCLKSFGTSADELVGGLCTMPCDPTLLDVDCDTTEPGSLCVPFTATENYCMEGCMLGGETGCSDREDVFCVDVAAEGSPVQAPVCLPFCVNDDQCTTGVCDHETGFCAAMTDPGTLALGAACTPPQPAMADAGAPEPAPDTCAEGFCVSITDDDSQGVCTQICRADVLPQCGWEGPPAAITGICLQAADSGALDLGLCRKTCNCDAECGNPDFVCFGNPQLPDFGAAGYCVLGTDTAGMPVAGIPTCPAP